MLRRPRARAGALFVAALLAVPVPALAAASTVAPAAWGAGAVARAQAAGFAEPSLRPDEALTLDDFIRWAVRADGRPLRPYNPAPGMVGLAGTPGLIDGSDEAAAAGGLLDFADYQTGVFPALEPISRQAAVVIAVRMLGLAPAARTAAAAASSLPFSDAGAVPGWARGFWAVAVQQGLVRGYPDGSLRPAGAMTAAEAATLLLRIQDLWRAEQVSGVTVAAPGGTARSALAARVGGHLYVSGDDLYGQLPDTTTGDMGDPNAGLELSVGAGNGVWRLQGTLTCTTGEIQCTFWDDTGKQTALPLAAAPIAVDGHVLLPVDGGGGGGGALPWLSVGLSGMAVTVAPGADWPGRRLPTSAGGAVLVQAAVPAVEPGVTYDVGVTFRDAAGEGISPVQPLAATFSAPADSPLLLGAGAGGTGPVAVSADIPSVPLHIPTTRNLPEGPFTVTEDLAGYASVTWPVRLHDPRPYSVSVQAPATAAVGAPLTVGVTLLDRHGAAADVSSAPAQWGVTAVGPEGAVRLDAQFSHPFPTVILLFDHGVAHYTFTPDRPGTYTVTASGAGADGWVLGPAQGSVAVG